MRRTNAFERTINAPRFIVIIIHILYITRTLDDDDDSHCVRITGILQPNCTGIIRHSAFQILQFSRKICLIMCTYNKSFCRRMVCMHSSSSLFDYGKEGFFKKIYLLYLIVSLGWLCYIISYEKIQHLIKDAYHRLFFFLNGSKECTYMPTSSDGFFKILKNSERNAYFNFSQKTMMIKMITRA